MGHEAGRRVLALMVPGSLLFVLSCAGPYYERAAISEGFSGGVGIGITAGDRATQEYNDIDAPRVVVRDVSGLGTAYFRCAESPSAAFFMQATAGYGAWERNTFVQDSEHLNELLTDVQLGMKFRAGRSEAIKAGVGWPGLLDIAYLHDFGRPLTAVVGAGLRGLSLGLTHHLDLSPALLQHTSLTIAAYPFRDHPTSRPWLVGAFLGVGWEFREREESDDREVLPDF